MERGAFPLVPGLWPRWMVILDLRFIKNTNLMG